MADGVHTLLMATIQTAPSPPSTNLVWPITFELTQEMSQELSQEASVYL